MLYKNLSLYMFRFDIVKINCIQDVLAIGARSSGTVTRASHSWGSNPELMCRTLKKCVHFMLLQVAQLYE